MRHGVFSETVRFDRFHLMSKRGCHLNAEQDRNGFYGEAS
jgi:hypothetical protein